MRKVLTKKGNVGINKKHNSCAVLAFETHRSLDRNLDGTVVCFFVCVCLHQIVQRASFSSVCEKVNEM